jgi:hypothetical protein
MPAARPLLERLGQLGEALMGTALAGLDEAEIAKLLASLSTVKENLRQAVQRKAAASPEQRYG